MLWFWVQIKVPVQYGWWSVGRMASGDGGRGAVCDRYTHQEKATEEAGVCDRRGFQIDQIPKKTLHFILWQMCVGVSDI